MDKLDKPGFYSKSGRRRRVSAMPLLSFLLLFCSVQVVAADAQLPQKNISLELRDVSVLDALREINRLSDNQLLFRNEEVAKETVRVNAEFRNTPVMEAVAQVLRGANLNHIVRGDVIVITPQDNVASGVVVDERGQPLAGVTVSVIGTSVGTATNDAGAFSVMMPDGRTKLRISYVGYTSQDVTAATNMRIVLKQEIYNIEDVVVTGMTRIDRRMFTGATDKLGADDVKLDGISDVSRALEGRSAGVTLQNVSSTFGTAPKIRVRGSTSILGSSKPLWVVDGVIVEDVGDISADDLSTGDAATLLGSAVAGLSADDIEDFQILKDGSATSIYGARAMAGVIVVTTKKGKAGDTRVNYTGEFTVRRKPNYLEYDIMNSQDQMSVYRDLDDKGWLNMERVLRNRNSGVYGQMYNLINTYDPSTGQFGLKYTDAAMNRYLREAEMRNTDWFDELFSNTVMQQHSVSISTGNHRATNYISLSVLDDPGWYRRSDLQRYTARANSNIHIYDNFQLTINTSASYRNQEAPGTMTQTANSVYGEVSREFDINPFSYAMNTSRTIAADEYHTRNYTTFNIHEELENNYMELNVINAAFQTQLTYNVIPELTLKALGSVNYTSNSMQWFVKDRSNAARAYRTVDNEDIAKNNPFMYTNPDNPYNLKESVLKQGGILDKTEQRMLAYNFRVDATYNKRFDSNNAIHIFGGMEIDNTQRSRDWFQGWGLLYDYGELASLDYLAFKKYDEESAVYYSLVNSNKRNVAFFTTATYSFRDKYTLNGTYRYEGTNRMGRSGNARWQPTWNLSGNWHISEEPFFAENTGGIFTEMKLRASYSLTADTGPSWVTNSTDLIYSNERWRHMTTAQEIGLYINESGNEDLTYEKKHELNIGLDFSVLKNRLSFQTDIYWRNNYDLIGLMGTWGLSGEIRRYANVADLKTRGFEITVSSRNIATPKFKWNSHLTFSKQKAEITSLLSNSNLFQLVRGTTLYSLQGYPTNALFSIPFTGLDSDGIPTFASPSDKSGRIDQKSFGENIFQITDENILKNYLKYEGPSEPTMTGGLSNTFTYGNLSLNVFMTYGFGNVIRLRPVFSYRYSDLTASSEVFKNRWMIPGDELTTDVPAIMNYRQYSDINMLRRGYSYYNYSTARIAKGDFVRMKEIALSYDFPAPVLKQLKMQRMTLKMAAVNPFLIYADKALNGQDPEFVESGGVSSPIAKQFTFTVRLGF